MSGAGTSSLEVVQDYTSTTSTELQKHIHHAFYIPRAYEAFLRQLHCKPPCDALQLLHRVLGVVNLNSSLCSSKRDIDHGTLEGHEHRQRLHLILSNMGTVTHTWEWG